MERETAAYCLFASETQRSPSFQVGEVSIGVDAD